MTEAELRTGAAKSSSPAKALRLVENFLLPLAVIEFTVARKLTLVTNNEREFRRVSGLGLENWTR